MRHFILAFFALAFLVACHKDDNAPTGNSGGKDSVKSPVPVIKQYAGSEAIKDWRNIYFTGGIFGWTNLDTTVTDTMTVTQIDSSTLTFHFAYWEVNNSPDLYPPAYQYYPPQIRLITVDQTFARNSAGRYKDSTRHHATFYTLSNDSLFINKYDSWGSDDYRDVFFVGTKL